MKEKNLVILCIIFAVLVGLVYLKQSKKPKIPTTEEITDIISLTLNSDNVKEIKLRLGDGTDSDAENPKIVLLAKLEDHWVIETHFGAYAREATITPVLEKLDQLQGELRSNKEGLLGDYEISDQEGIHVEIQRQDGEMLHLIVGTKKVGFQNNFIRHDGSNAVYIVNENLLAILGVRGEGDGQRLDSNKWIDKRISHVNASEVVGVTITESDASKQTKVMDLKRELVDEKRKWQSTIPYDFGLSASKIKTTIELFNNTYASEIVTSDVEGAFDAPGRIWIFTLDDSNQIEFVRGAKDDTGSNYYVKHEGAGYFYLVPVSTFNSRINKQGSIFANNPLKVKESNVKKIEIRDLNTKKVFSAIKKDALQASDESDPEKTDGDQTDKKEDSWETPNGEVVEIAKVRSAINAVKNIGLEIVMPPAKSLKNLITIHITKEDGVQQVNISEIFKLDIGKECHFLSVDGSAQSYCVSKSSITPLQNALP